MLRLRRVIVLLLALSLCATSVVAQERGETTSVAETSQQKSLAGSPISMESRPYRVRLLATDESGDFAPLRREISSAFAKSVGQLWDIEIEELTGLVRCDAGVLGRWSPADVRERCADDEIEFWYFAALTRRGSRIDVAVRAWQPQFDWLSPVLAESGYEPRSAPGRIAKLCWKLFRPQVLIEHVDQNAVRVRIPAGGLVPADPAFQLFQPGDCLIPWLMYYDRNKTLQRKQELPWSYVRLDHFDPMPQEKTVSQPDAAEPREPTRRGTATGTVLSGLRTPLAGKTRGKIDKVAVASRPVYPETKLQIGVQNQPARTLAGYRLELRPKLPERKPEGKPKAEEQEADADEQVTRLLTDRLGEATLKPDGVHPQLWVYVHSGDLLLARVPFVPGSLPFMRLDVPDDSVRLQVEGDLQVLQSELINLVAERNTLIAAARAASKKGDWQRVDVLRKQLDQLPPKQTFLSKLAGIRVPAVSAVKGKKDRNGQVRIERLCKDVSELIDRYLDPDKLQLIKDELDQLAKDAKIEPTT